MSGSRFISLRSPWMSSKLPDSRSFAMLPRLIAGSYESDSRSMPTTDWPDAITPSASREPMKPATPVISTLTRSPGDHGRLEGLAQDRRAGDAVAFEAVQHLGVHTVDRAKLLRGKPLAPALCVRRLSVHGPPEEPPHLGAEAHAGKARHLLAD